MAITDLKLKDSDIAAKGVAAAPTVLNGTPEENKKVFDRLVREVLKGDFNGLIDALAAATGAGEIGAAVEGLTGATVQAILNAIKAALDAKASDAATSAALEGKADKTTIRSHIKDVQWNSKLGIFTFTRQDGSKITVDLAMQKVAVNFAYDKASQSLKLTLADGSTETVPLSDFITATEFEDSDTLKWSVSTDGSMVEATIKTGSITDTMLSSALKTMLEGYVTAAAASATAAAGSESSALSYKNAAASAASDAQQQAISADSAAGAAQQAADDAEESATAASQSANAAGAASANAEEMESRSADNAEDAEAWAVGQRNGVDVGADDPAYHNNAKYWAEQAPGGGTGGTPGADGKSAYEIAVEEGFEGDKAAWLASLKGEQGPGAEVYYVDLTGTYPTYTCSTAMADIAAAYAAGKELKCRCAMSSAYTAVLPLFLPLPSANTWVFSGAGALTAMGFPAQSLTVAIINGTVSASDTQLAKKDDIPTIPESLKNPNALTVKIGDTTVTYDGSTAQTVEITGDDDGTPAYVLTAADALTKKVTGHIGADNIVFAVMTDAHLGVYTDTDNVAGKQAGQALKRLNERCALDFVAHCGDYTTGAWNTDVEATLQDNADYQLLIGSQYPGKAVWCVGNHDDAPYQATASRMTQTQVYAAIARKNLASGGVVPNNACYGYTDFPGMRLRVIYLDTHDRRSWGSAQVGAGAACDYLNVENISAVQLQWLADHALDFSGVDDPSKWSILIFSHAVLGTSGTYTAPNGTVHPCNTANAATLLKAYATKKSGSITHGGVAVNYNFTAVTPAGIIGCIHGHEHRYANETVGGAFLSICCPNITNGRERASADGNTYSKTAGTANGTSFCVFSINRADKKIYVDHYGPGIDREFDYTVIDPSAPSYTNLLPSATDTDGSVYNDVGYAVGQRLNSSGTAEDYAGMYLTGFIPVSLGDVVRLKNVTWQYGVTSGITSNNQRICFYDSSKAHIGLATGTSLSGVLSGVKDDSNIWTQFTVRNSADLSLNNAAYFRLCCAGITSESIITVNEEIT